MDVVINPKKSVLTVEFSVVLEEVGRALDVIAKKLGRNEDLSRYGLLRRYKRWISPAFPPSCRYVPTCSEYAMEAVERYGALRGGVLAAWRLLRCHPLAKGGLDPVVKIGCGSRRLRQALPRTDSRGRGPYV